MIVSIMQPTYLPWLGYFDLIARSDIFVFLDDVQFSYRSWQQRNRILDLGKEKMLTVPVVRRGNRTNIVDTVIDESQLWREKHFNSIKNAYKKTKHYPYYIRFFEKNIFKNRDCLNDLNQNLVKSIAFDLGLNKKFLASSELKCSGLKSEKLFNICKKLGATQYLSAVGSHSYIEEEGIFKKNNLKVIYQDYTVHEYRQVGTKSFVPYLSIIDFLFNCGTEDLNSHLTI